MTPTLRQGFGVSLAMLGVRPDPQVRFPVETRVSGWSSSPVTLLKRLCGPWSTGGHIIQPRSGRSRCGRVVVTARWT
jgi:hypothetical protein